MDISKQSSPALLRLHAEIGDALRARGVLRSTNNPTGDLAEHLFCNAFGWEQAANSVRGYDAVCAQGLRYQIKARKLHPANTSRQLSALRGLNERPFDTLAGILFDERFEVRRAALIPIDVIQAQARYNAHTNSHRFMLTDAVWEQEGVEDVTVRLRQAFAEL